MMKTRNYLLSFVILFSVVFTSCLPVKLTLESKNSSTLPMAVDVESYNKKGDLKRNTGFISKGKESDIATVTKFEVDAFKGGFVKLKYRPEGLQTSFNLDEIKVPKASEDFNKVISLSEINKYNEADEKEKLLQLSTNLNLQKTDGLERLIDIQKELSSLVIGQMIDNELHITDYYDIQEEEIEYDKPKENKNSAITDKKVMANVAVSIPIYGDVQSNFENNNLHKVMWEIKYYNYSSTFNAGLAINSLKDEDKAKLVATLELYPDQEIFILRKFDIIESGSFISAKTTEILTSADIAIASVFKGNTAYTFKADDNKIVTIPSQAYNFQYKNLISVNDLINVLNDREQLQQSLVENLISPAKIHRK